jgi:penicillin-binding protein 1A
MMAGVISVGTGRSARIPGWQAAGKTGTTQSFRDALFVGFTNEMTTGVWFGNDDGKSMKKVTGGGLPAKAWKEFMVAAHKGLTPTPIFGGGQIIDNGATIAATGKPTTIESILSGVLGNDSSAGAPPATVPGTRVATNEEPQDMPAAGAGDDINPYASRHITPPADIGEPASGGNRRPHRTTLLDLILGN